MGFIVLRKGCEITLSVSSLDESRDDHGPPVNVTEHFDNLHELEEVPISLWFRLVSPAGISISS